MFIEEEASIEYLTPWLVHPDSDASEQLFSLFLVITSAVCLSLSLSVCL